MKIAYATTYDASDVHHWSGTGHYVARALQKQNLDLDFIGPLPAPKALWPAYKAKGLLYNRLLKKRYHRGHDVATARYYARRIDERLKRNGNTELVFGPGNIPLAFLETDHPMAFWGDATHANLFDFYPEYTNMCAQIVRDGHTIEQRAIDRASAVILSSEWAAQSALHDYGADPAKVHVVPFGANLENPPSFPVVSEMIRSRSNRVCKLLFIGVDWNRKGGDTALAVAEQLNQIGLPTELTVVGCNPFDRETQPEFVRCEGFLSKRNEADRRRIEFLLAETHFLIVPSRAECFGIVYCEANAFGVPCLARSVGGVSTIIKSGINGHLFHPGDSPESYVRLIEESFQHYDRYQDLAKSSFEEFRTRLNWEVTGKQVRDILCDVAQGKRKNPSPKSDTKQWPHQDSRRSSLKRALTSRL